MRGYKSRLLSCGLFVALVAWIISWGGHTALSQPVAQPFPGQPVPPDQPPGKKDGKKDDRSPADENLPFAPPYDRDIKKQLAAARDYLAYKNPPYNTICPLLQGILDAKSDSFFDVPYEAGGKIRINRISVKTEVNRILAAFPKEGIEFYQQLYGTVASDELEKAVPPKGNYDLAILSDVSQRYFFTKAGAEATVILASVYLERGNYLEAAYAFERLLPRKDVDHVFTPLTLFKACVALKRSGDPRLNDLYKVTLERLDEAAKNGVTIGRVTYTKDKIRTELNRAIETLQATSVVGEWTMRGGNPTRAAIVDGGPPFLDPIFRTTMFYTGEDEGNVWIKSELDKLFSHTATKAQKVTPLPGTFPISTQDLLIFRTYDAVTAVYTRDRVFNGSVVRAGEIAWRSKTTAGLHQLVTNDGSDDMDMKTDVQHKWWGTYVNPAVNVSSILYENPLVGSLAHDGQYVYAIDDIAITPPPQMVGPEFGGPQTPQFRQSGDLADMVRAGRLVAIDIKSGKVKWDLGRVKRYPPEPGQPPPPPLPPPLNEEEADKSTDVYRLCLDAVFLGPPLPLNGKLYVLIEQGGIIRLLCLDPKNLIAGPGPARKPALVWSQKLGRPNNTLPQDSVRRYQCATLAASDGILVCPTNCGVVVAVDIMSRSLLWAHGYRNVDATPRPIRYGPDGRPILPNQLPLDRWHSAGPVISNGRVIVTAYDSERLECLDLRTGKVLWWVPRDPNDLYVGGVVNDRVIVVGKNQVRAFLLTGEDKETQKPKLAWDPISIPTPTGHGAMGRNAYFIPVKQENAGVNTIPAAEIWAVNIATGQITSKTAARKRNDTAELAKYGLGNLIFQDGMVFAQSPWEIACYPQLELKIKEMNELLAKNPKDPVGLLARGELNLDDGKLKEAVADFKEAEKNELPAEKRPLLREKLYIAYTELLRADFNGAEGFLKEYEALCEVPQTAAFETPEDKLRRFEETNRRKRLYFYLLARGRETQGRLGEAFDYYLQLSALGESKQLLEMPDEPNVRMRPDVWARGRIESMIRRANTPEAKKSLEDRVLKEWDQVKDGQDLKRLREFVAVFGPFFATGAEAQFLLADTLLATGNDADLREAQTHLSQLRVAADSPQIRARATEKLAQLMIKSRMMEDAVGLYLELGREYPDVVIRDGKTGADFLTGLLTDKRLLPFLEPTRYPMPTRVKAEQRNEQQNVYVPPQFGIDPPAGLFPMYKQWRFSLDQANGPFMVRAFDRATGQEKARFPNMQIPNLYSQQGYPIQYSRFVQGQGHIMLIQIGSWVYCLDLAEKKELWNRNLLGDMQGAVIQPRVEMATPDGDVTVHFAEGYVVTLGRAAVLQPSYVCLLTRDGLECVEPMTRRILWTRKGMAERTQIYGDARYIVVVELDNQRKPVATKLIRAVDGLVVENSPDSGRVLADARSFRIEGRTALLFSGTGEEPRVLRLYDLATGKDVWKREFPAKAVPITAPLNADWTGYITPDGTAEVLDVTTGKTVAKMKLDEKTSEAHLKSCIGAQVLADNDRFYLILDRDPNAGSTNGSLPVTFYNAYQLRSQKVNGPIYAFDRRTSKRLWLYEDVLENQWLILEQFIDSPVIIATAPQRFLNKPQYEHWVVMIEKERGRLVFHKPVVYNGNFFHSLTVDPKNGTLSLNRFDLRINVTPDEPKGDK